MTKTSIRNISLLSIALVFLCCLGLVSILKTMGIAEGAFPSGEFELKIHDESGGLIEGAVLNIYEGGTRSPAFGYPIDNYSAQSKPTTNDLGLLKAIHKDRGFEYGGPSFGLYWLIPIDSPVPQFDCEITAEGYKPTVFPIDQLFKEHSQVIVLEH